MTTRGCSILLVDDQPARLARYDAVLRPLAHRVVHARSVTGAMQQMMSEDFAAVLLNVNMPGMDGFEAMATIHQHPGLARTPVIFVSTLDAVDMDACNDRERGRSEYVRGADLPEILCDKVRILVELYLKRREIERLNQSLEYTNTELALANDALRLEVAERKRAESALHEANCRMDEFMAMLSHELRNPLAAIISAVQVMKLKALADPQLTWTRDVLWRQAMHLTGLLEDLLDVSRITGGKLTLRREMVDLAMVMTQVIETTVPIIRERRHTLSVVLPNCPVRVKGDLVRLTEVVGTLLTNAAKTTDDGGHIELILEAHDEESARHAIIRVRDTGVGIPPAILPRIFDLFTRAERTGDAMPGGLGIGLAVVRGLVEMHGGTIHVHSEGVGRGSEFVVRLPATESAFEMTEIVISPVPEPSPVTLSVLIVDDNEDAARSVGMLLEMEGYEVHLAHAGLTALNEAFEHLPDVILLDIGLPDMNGYDVARRLREHSQFRTTKLIAMTGYGRDADRQESEEAGFDHHLVKPVDFEKLHELLAVRSFPGSMASRSIQIAG